MSSGRKRRLGPRAAPTSALSYNVDRHGDFVDHAEVSDDFGPDAQLDLIAQLQRRRR